MILQSTDETGMEEWYCPDCGHRFLMHWPPEYKKIMLEAGDEQAIHTGGKGGLEIQSPQIIVEPDESNLDDPDLLLWKEWMEQVNFDELWEKDL